MGTGKNIGRFSNHKIKGGGVGDVGGGGGGIKK